MTKKKPIESGRSIEEAAQFLCRFCAAPTASTMSRGNAQSWD